MDHERAAADAGTLRLHQGQDHLHRDGGIHGATTGAQHGKPGLRGVGIGGSDHVSLGLRGGELCAPGGNDKERDGRSKNFTDL